MEAMIEPQTYWFAAISDDMFGELPTIRVESASGVLLDPRTVARTDVRPARVEQFYWPAEPTRELAVAAARARYLMKQARRTAVALTLK
jgi:hypothetical protein